MVGPTGMVRVILYVQDMEAMVAFYRDTIGFQVQYTQNVKGYKTETWVTFHTGASTLALHAGGKPNTGEGTLKIVFGVRDIEHARSYLLQRRVRMGEVQSAPGGILFCDGYDPEGNPFQLEYQEIITDIPTQPLP